MPLNVWQRSVVDEAGNVMPEAEVEVRDQVTSNLVQLYEDYDGATPLGNPFDADEDGFVCFYAETGRYRITATSGDLERIWENEQLGVSSDDINRITQREIDDAGLTEADIDGRYPSGHVHRYRAVGDGEADDSQAVRYAILSGEEINFTTGLTYILSGTFNFVTPRQTINVNGATLRGAYSLVSPFQLSLEASNVIINLGGGVIDQGCPMLQLAADATDGGTTLTVTDGSQIEVGQKVASSWSDAEDFYPLDGQTGRTILSKAGDVLTLSAALTAGSILPSGLYVGAFTYTAFVTMTGNDCRIVGGEIRGAYGYYYFTPEAAVGGDIYFEDVFFGGNGLDGFLIRGGQRLFIRRCKGVRGRDVAKSGIFWYGDASCYIEDSKLPLGHYDFPFAITGDPSDGNTIANGELIIKGSTIDGTTVVHQSYGGYSGDGLFAIYLGFNGNFDNIQISDSKLTHFQRAIISTGSVGSAYDMTVGSIKLSDSRLEASPLYIFTTGSGNGFVCPDFSYSVCTIVHTSAYDLLGNSATSSAVNDFYPEFYDCNWQLTGTAANSLFNIPCRVLGGRFSGSTGLGWSTNVAQIDDVVVEGPLFVRLTSDDEYHGAIGRVISEHAVFPDGNLASFFTGPARNGAVIASIKADDGSVYYDFFWNSSGALALSGEFKWAGVGGWRGSDYYIPVGSRIRNIQTGAETAVTFNLVTNLGAAAAAGVTSLTVLSGASVVAGDKVNILCDNGLVDTRVVDGAYVSGTTIPLTAATSNAAANGSKVNFWRS